MATNDINVEVEKANWLVDLSSVSDLIKNALNEFRAELQGANPMGNAGVSAEALTQMQTQLTQLETTLTNHSNTLNGKAEEYQQLNTQLTALSASVEHFTQQLSTESQQRTTAIQSLETAQQALETAQQALETAQQAVATLSEAERTKLGEIDTLQINTTHAHKRSTQVFTRGKGLDFYGTTAGNNAISDTPYFRIPAHVITPDGTIIVTADYREDPADQVKIGIAAALSYDGGATWEYAKCVDLLPKADGTIDSRSRIMDSTLLATQSKKVFLLAGGFKQGTANWTRHADYNLTASGACRIILAKTDHSSQYKTWTQSEITVADLPANVKMLIGGVGTGIEMDGQLIFPVQYTTGNGAIQAGLMVSNDDGTSWHWGGTGRAGASENMVCQYPEDSGQLLAIGRIDGARNRGVWQYDGTGRAVTSTNNEGLSNLLPTYSNTACQGSTISFTTQAGKFMVLTSMPQNRLGNYNRDRITVYYLDVEHNVRYPLLVVNYHKGASKEANGTPYGGYSSLYYANTEDGEMLSIAFEDDLGVRYMNLSDWLPRIETLVDAAQYLEQKNSGVTAATYLPSPNVRLVSRFLPRAFNKEARVWKRGEGSGKFNLKLHDVNGSEITLDNHLVKMRSTQLNRIEATHVNKFFSGADKLTVIFDLVVPSAANNIAGQDNWQPVFLLLNQANAILYSMNIKKFNNNDTAISLNPTNQSVITTEIPLPLGNGIALDTPLRIAQTFSGNTGAIYVNGVKRAIVNRGTPYGEFVASGERWMNNIDRILIGQNPPNLKKVNFGLGDIQIYKGELTAEEVMAEFTHHQSAA